MEKIFIKPSTHEILIKSATDDGHMDIFSYDPADEQTKKLGHLYVIGHVQHETDDMTYAINLISALAKREYYTSATTAKEAFAATLKKVNEVVEEFFEHKGVKINIGVFAIAGEQMYISKLGKFKVLLARENNTIDVLNHISFDKEKVQEKQFSNVISGQVRENDRILAYYPSRAVVARERYLKMYLHKYDPVQFAEQLKSLKKEKSGFSCAMLYLNLDKMKEVTSTPRIEPRELIQPQATAAPASPRSRTHAKLVAEDPVPEDDEPATRQVSEGDAVERTKVTKYPSQQAGHAQQLRSEGSEMPKPAGVVQDMKRVVSTTKRYVETQQEVPHIIPTEFSLGKKDHFITSTFSRIRFNRLTPRSKAILSLSAVGLIVGVTFAIQFAFGINPDAREANATVKAAQEQLELARVRINQQDTTGARSILSASLAGLIDKDNEKVAAVRTELQKLLDELDQAEDVSASIVAQVPQDLGVIQLLYETDKAVYAYTKPESGDAQLVTIEGESVSKSTPVPNTNGSYLTSSTKGTPIVVDIGNQKTVAVKDSLEVATFTLPQPILATYVYEDNLYSITPEGIYRFADVFKGEAKAQTWLKKDQTVLEGAKRMVVDGNIYIMNGEGVLKSYFRGEKNGEFHTGLAVTDNHILATSNDSPSLYLVDTRSGKINVLDKKTGTLLKTLRTGSQQPILTAAVGKTGILYFATNDNKIWKIVAQ